VKPNDIRNMTAVEIEQKIASLKEEQFNLRSEMVSGRVERPHRFSAVKNDIARCYTILKEKTSEG
jgi:large subunit ribosomal protein L29